MKRPYIICHMAVSLDGKVTGDFLQTEAALKSTEIYYKINSEIKCDGFICGRITTEENFTGRFSSDLSDFPPVRDEDDFIPEKTGGFYTICFDPKGRVDWPSAFIKDKYLGYDNSKIIEVVTKAVNKKYLSYLKSLNIPYIFAGDKEIDVNTALEKLYSLFGVERVLLDSGSIINRYFKKASFIDELSLVYSPVIAGNSGKPLFVDADIQSFNFYNSKIFEDGTVWLNYRKKDINNKEEHIRQKIIIQWSEPIPFEEALHSEKTNTQGLYYITRTINRKNNKPKETSLYIGKATNSNTIKNRLKAHKQNWIDLWYGKKFVRIGKIVYPELYFSYDEALIIDHAESAILAEEKHKNIFLQNTDKRNTFSFYNLYEIENKGKDIGELERIIKMKEK